MGARPIASMNALRFGEPSHPKTARLLEGVVAGIAGYGNCIGVPTVAGEVVFDASYNGNCLVNAFTLGILKSGKIFRGTASRAGSGLLLDVDAVPRRESGMTPYEVMLSESQERMLLVARKGREKEVFEICDKWDLAHAIVGRVTDSGKLVVQSGGAVVAELPIAPLTEEAPQYDRPRHRPA